MWALGVIAIVVVVGALARYFVTRENVQPMERHVRALDALRNVAQLPRPEVSDAPPSDLPTDHVRILADAPDDERRTPRAPARRPTARPEWVTDRPTIAIRPGRERREPVGEPIATPVGGTPYAGAPVGGTPYLGLPELDDGGGGGFGASRTRIYAGGAVAAAVVLVGIIVATSISGRGTERATAPKEPVSHGSTAPAVVSTSSPSTSSTTVPGANPVVTRTADGATVTLRSPFVLTLRTTAACWVQITDRSGTTLFADTLPSGAVQPIPGGGTIVMKLGNMSGVTISVGGVDLDLAGLPQTANITFQTA